MSTYFCLSYNVNVRDDEYESKIDSFRSKIEKHLSEQDDFSDVYKEKDVDTTIIGKINTSGHNDDARKKNIKDTITSTLKALAENSDIPTWAIDVDCVVMTGNIEKPFSFRAI